jgi:hypothetical protein
LNIGGGFVPLGVLKKLITTKELPNVLIVLKTRDKMHGTSGEEPSSYPYY